MTRAFLLALAAAAVALPASAGSMGTEIPARVYKKTVETHPSQGEVGEVEGSEAILLTTPKGAFASLDTSGLTPGHAYTMWFVTINNPGACESTPCKGSDVLGNSGETRSDIGYGAGAIADADGRASFVTHREKGEMPAAWIGTGFTQPESAEIHLAIHDHGPVIEGREAEMMRTFRGGCTEESLSEMAPDTARADGKPGPNSCKMVQDVIFMQNGSQTATQ